MITREQATIAALELFGTEFHDGVNCKAELGREGKPCRYCADLSRLWQARINQVQKAIEKALATP